jgi:hypothetical protein
MSTKDFKKYLPSKQFTTSLIVIVVIISFGFLIKGLFSIIKKSINNKKNGATVEVVTVGETIQEDANNNGIPDWEEYIWGLDPTKNGPENKAFILAKKKTLVEGGDLAVDESGRKITDNEMLSRSLLATILALESSGGVDDESIKNISETIGNEIIAEELPNKYTFQDLKVVSTSNESEEKYHNDFTNIYNNYIDKDIGTEITLISIGLANGDVQSLRAAKTIALYYKDFASEIAQINVPSSISNQHLEIVNDLVKISTSLEGLTMSLADPMLGMKSAVLYNKYSEDLVQKLDEVANILQSI